MRQDDVSAATKLLAAGCCGDCRGAADSPMSENGGKRLTHLAESGCCRTWSMSAPRTRRCARAIAEGAVRMLPETLELILAGNAKKGDVIGIARIAGNHGRQEDARPDPALPPAAADSR